MHNCLRTVECKGCGPYLLDIVYITSGCFYARAYTLAYICTISPDRSHVRYVKNGLSDLQEAINPVLVLPRLQASYDQENA